MDQRGGLTVSVDIEGLGQTGLVPVQLLIEEPFGEMHVFACILLHDESDQVGVLVFVRTDDKSFAVQQVFIGIYQCRADGNDGLFDFVEQTVIDVANIKETFEEGIQSRTGEQLPELRQVMQAVEGVVARHIDGLHDHPGLFGMVGAYVFHAPCFDVQYLPDLMGNHVLIVHFRQGFAVVHGVHVRVDHHLPCQRLPQRRAAHFVPQELPDRTRFVHRVHLAGDGGVACFADRVGVGAVSLALVKILQGHGGCFEGLQCRTIPPVKPATSSTSSEPGTQSDAIAKGFVLDHERIAELQRETAEVSALLAQVFTDDQVEELEQSVEAVEPATETSADVAGLDLEHSAFLRLLISRAEWSRSELEAAASDMELMLDGALEQINDMAFERFDMPVTEGDDPIEINTDILEELAL